MKTINFLNKIAVKMINVLQLRKVLSYALTLTLTLTVSSQITDNEGLFNKNTDQKLSYNEWMKRLPDHYDIFEEEAPLKITLETNFKQLSRDRYKNNYQAALLYFPLDDSLLVKRVIRVKPRGKFRRQYCSRPPLKLNFKKTKLFIKEIESLEKIKMVYDCKRNDIYNQYLLKEYLAYKIYNILSPYSFKVRLLDIDFIDTGRKAKKTESEHSFLIEETQKLAERNNLYEAKSKRAIRKDIEDLQMARISIFQYAIGNSDWSVTGLHNIKLFTHKTGNNTKAIAVPYDFDYSGIVDAIYAIPSENLDINSVTERYFLGPCYSKETYEIVLKEFITKKSEIYNMIENFDVLKERSKKNILNYLDSFYSQIEKKNATSYFLNNCLG